MLRLIDAHSHIFKSYNGPSSDPDVYLREATKLGVRVGIVSPGPTPDIYVSENIGYRPCRWKHDGDRFNYFQQWYDIKTKNVLFEAPAQRNPYHRANDELLQLSQCTPKDQTQLSLMPLLHPILDDNKEWERWAEDPDIHAFKWHGVATATSVEAFSDEKIRILRESKKPLIAHTDWYDGSPSKPSQKTFAMNDPRKIASWAVTNNLKVMMAHGARLSPEAISTIDGNKNIKVGIAPGPLIMADKGRLFTESDDYELSLLKMCKSDQLLFDIDFAWNVHSRDRWDIQDWGSVARIEEKADEAGLNTTQIEDIMYRNSEEFYRI